MYGFGQPCSCAIPAGSERDRDWVQAAGVRHFVRPRYSDTAWKQQLLRAKGENGVPVDKILLGLSPGDHRCTLRSPIHLIARVWVWVWGRVYGVVGRGCAGVNLDVGVGVGVDERECVCVCVCVCVCALVVEVSLFVTRYCHIWKGTLTPPHIQTQTCIHF